MTDRGATGYRHNKKKPFTQATNQCAITKKEKEINIKIMNFPLKLLKTVTLIIIN